MRRSLQGKDTLQCCEQPFIQLLYCWSIIVSNWVAFANDILAKNGGGVKMLETLETMGLLRSFKFKIPSNLHLGVSKTDFEGRPGILSQGSSAWSLLYIFPMNTFHRQDCSSSLILRTAEFCSKVLRLPKVNFAFPCFAQFQIHPWPSSSYFLARRRRL